MKTLTTCFIAAAAIALPFAAYADNASYCADLSKSYRAYAAANSANDTATVAMAKCASGNTAEGIPVLEKILNDAKVPLPKKM